MVAALISVWLGYNTSQPQIEQAPPQGLIRVYFNKPGVLASVQVSAQPQPQDSSLGDKYEIYLHTLESYEEPLRFYIVLAGSARPAEHWGRGDMLDLDDKNCLPTVSAAAGPISCSESRGAPDSLFAAESAKEPVTVISGRLSKVDRGGGDAHVDVSSRDSTERISGATTSFQLPTIGTTNFPENIRDTLPVLVDGTDSMFVPTMAVTVTYRYLSASDSLATVSPEPNSRRPLTWIELDGGSIDASGTVVNQSAQRDADRDVFMWGALIGTLGGLLISLGSSWRSSAIEGWAWFRDVRAFRNKTRI